MKNETNRDYKKELSHKKQVLATKDKRILRLEDQIKITLITVQVAYETTEDEKTKEVLKKLIK